MAWALQRALFALIFFSLLNNSSALAQEGLIRRICHSALIATCLGCQSTPEAITEPTQAPEEVAPVTSSPIVTNSETPSEILNTQDDLKNDPRYSRFFKGNPEDPICFYISPLGENSVDTEASFLLSNVSAIQTGEIQLVKLNHVKMVLIIGPRFQMMEVLRLISEREIQIEIEEMTTKPEIR